MSVTALVLDARDNVATAVRPLESGVSAEVMAGDVSLKVLLRRDIPFGHKFALRDIGRGEDVIKYGEVIGRATEPIGEGEHVHLHNVEGLRGRGDRR